MTSVQATVIPILPCRDIKAQATFYEQLGFEITGLFTSPNLYATVKMGTIELHFWGSLKNNPSENPSMCYIRVEDVDHIYETLISGSGIWVERYLKESD